MTVAVKAAMLACWLLFSDCASTVQVYPYRAKLVDSQGLFLLGWVRMQRSDGVLIFECDDQQQGDHGLYYIDPTNPDEDKRLSKFVPDSDMSARYAQPPAAKERP